MRRIALVFVLALGACVVESRSPSTVTTGAPSTASPNQGTSQPVVQGPIECSGQESVVLDGCWIEGEVAVQAHGNCSVILTDCTIRASATAVAAHGNASVQLRGGTLEAPVAVEAHGNAAVDVAGALVTGEVMQHGNAVVNVH